MSIELFLLATLIGGAASIVFGRVFSALPNPYKDYCQRWEALNAKNQETIEKLFGALEERNEQCNAWRECASRLLVYAECMSARVPERSQINWTVLEQARAMFKEESK